MKMFYLQIILLHLPAGLWLAPLVMFIYSLFISQITTEKHRMSFPETVDEILDVSEDEGGYDWLTLA